MKHVFVYFKALRYHRDHVLITDAYPVFWSYKPITPDVAVEIGIAFDFCKRLALDDAQVGLLFDLVPYVLDH